jgi:hypothetical protein
MTVHQAIEGILINHVHEHLGSIRAATSANVGHRRASSRAARISGGWANVRREQPGGQSSRPTDAGLL